MSLIGKDEYLDSLHGFNITDCVVRDKDIYYFIGREDYSLWPKEKWDRETTPPPDEPQLYTHIIAFVRDLEFGKRMGKARVSGLDKFYAGASQKPASQFVGVSMAGDVYSSGSGARGLEADVKAFGAGGPARGAIHSISTIGGYLYFCGGGNSVGKRIAKDTWHSFSNDIPNPKRKDANMNSLDDIDGFHENDIYCVGNEGTVFHFNGEKWNRLGFPSNVDLETVCCAGDGYVYISGKKGVIFKGRANKWKKIHDGGMSLPFRDMVWHQDRVWCCGNFGMWAIQDDKLKDVDLPEGFAVYTGNLSAADGVLLTAGLGGAAYMENGQWHKIFSMSEMRRLAKG